MNFDVHNNQELFYKFVKFTPAAVAMLDKNMCYIVASKRWITEFRLNIDDVTGLSHYDVFPDLVESWKDDHQRVLNGVIVKYEDEKFPRADGTIDWLRRELHPWYDADSQVGGIIMFHEITTKSKQAEYERNKLEQQLVQSQKMDAVGQLAAGIAHDFNNILASILGFAKLAQNLVKDQGDDKLENYLKHITKAGYKGKKIVSQMMLLSRPDVQSKTIISIYHLVKNTMNLLIGSLPSTININTNMDEDTPSIFIDPVQLEQIIMNLCINSRDAMSEIGELDIELHTFRFEEGQNEIASLSNDTKTKRIEMCFCHDNKTTLHTGDYVELLIRDTGEGIPEDKLKHIFEPFYTTKEVGKGTGLGLYMIHGIMQDACGHIIVESEKDKGTLFRLLFKACASLEPNEKISESIKLTRHLEGSGCILVVDDDDSLLEYMEEMLSENGYEVVRSENGEAALNRFLRSPEKFNMVITDQTMPKVAGTELSKKLLEIRPNIPIILLTGHSELINETQRKDLGICAYLEKPIDPDQLLKIISESMTEKMT
jgi:signal transduction histidine kinase/ActR/RegA family two-component response regulator